MRGGSEPDVTLLNCGCDHTERAKVIDTDSFCSLVYKMGLLLIFQSEIFACQIDPIWWANNDTDVLAVWH